MEQRRRLPGRKCIPLFTVGISLMAIFFALAVGGVLIAITGTNPILAYWHMFYGALGNAYGLGETFTKFVPLLLCALGFTIAQKSGFFNMGAEGQLYFGALGALLVGGYLKGLPAPVHVLLTLLAAFAAGALCSAIAGVLKLAFGASELLNTMMLNYIIALLVDLLLQTGLKDPSSMIDQSIPVAESARLPVILTGTRLHLGVLLTFVILIVVWDFYQHTSTGFEMRLTGANSRAARYAGINTTKTLLIAVVLSGGLAGIGGGMELIGNQYRLMPGFSPGYGFDAIGIAVMGQYNPIGIVLSAFLFAVLRVGAGAMQRGVGVPMPLVSVIQGIIIVTVIVSSYFTRKLSDTIIGGRA